MGEDHGKDYISYFESDYPCSVCDRWCKNENELNRHMKVYHSKRVKYCGLECNNCDENLGDKDELMKYNEKEHVESMNISQNAHQGESLVSCNICDEKFETRRILMVHKKKEHIEKVAVCWNISSGHCALGDDFCWFSHSNNSYSTETFKCNICEQNFKTKNDLQLHKKRDHSMNVPPCQNASNETC